MLGKSINRLSKSLAILFVAMFILNIVCNINIIFAAPVFYSDFETGSLNEWDGTLFGGGANAPTVQNNAYQSKYALVATAPLGANIWSVAYKNFPYSYNVMYFRSYVRFSATPSAGQFINIYPMIANDSSTALAYMHIYNDAGTLKWRLGYRTDSSNQNFALSANPPVQANQWYYVEVMYKLGNGNGEVKAWIAPAGSEIDESSPTISVTRLTNDDFKIGHLQVGVFRQTSLAISVYHDAIIASTTYIGPEGTEPGPNTAPVCGDLNYSSTLAGSTCLFSSLWSDDVGLSHYIFRTNITGNWEDDAPVAFNSTHNWASVPKVLPSSVGVVVGYQWFVNDTDNEWTSTSVQTLVTTATPPAPSVLFSSGFESGGTNEWNGVVGAPFIVTSPVHCGSYALGCDNSNEYVYKTISASELYFRAYVQFSAVPSLYETVIFYKMHDSLNGRDVATLGLTNIAGTIRWRLTYFDNSNRIVTSQQQTGAVINTWYCVELRVKCSTTNAEYQVWINGNELTDIAQTGRNSVSTAVNRVLLGETYEDLRAPFTVYSDCVVASDRYIGVETSNAAPNCNYVGKSSSVAGSNCVFSSYWTDDSGLSQYIFSTNNTGKWKNDTALAFSSTPGWANAIKTLNTTIGSVIAYRWFAQDANGLWAATEIQTLTTVSQPEQRGVVSIVFDDNYRDQYDYAYPLMNIRGITGTFYVVTNQIGVSGRMTFQQLQTLQNSGNEIGSHSVSHPSSFTSLTAEQIHYQCSTSKQVLQDHGLFVNNFAYPDGLTNDAVDSIVSNYYRSGRTAYIEPYINDFSQAQFKRISAFNAENNSAELAELEAMVDQVYETDGWGVFFFHHIIPSDYHSQYTTSSQDFASFLDYVLSKGVQILTVNQALDLSQGNVDPSINVNIELPGTTLKYTFDIGATWTAPGQVVVGGQTLSFVRWSDGSTDLTKTFTASGSYTAIYESP